MTSTLKKEVLAVIPKSNQENYDPIQNPKLNYTKQQIDWISNIQISKQNFDFSTMLPGEINELEFSITNPTKHSMELRILVECLNPEFDDLDEYVFTLRSSESNNYHHRHRTLFIPYSRAYFKVAIKVPNVEMNREIQGRITLQFSKKGENPSQQKLLPLSVKCEIPKLYCPKIMELNPFPCLRITAKKGRKTEYKIPLKNDSDFDLNFNMEIVSKDSDALLFTSNNSGYLSRNSSGVILLGVRGAIQAEKKKSRKVLILKIRGSSMMVSIPIEIEIL